MKSQYLLKFIPAIGILLFIILYILATFFYPGGSQLDKNAKGFSWSQNYWCNLLNEKAVNGEYNRAQPIAITALVVVGLSLSIFWFQFAKHVKPGKYLNYVIPLSGLMSLVTAIFLFTNINHDLITNLASSFGLLAILGTLAGLNKMKWRELLFWGLFNLLLILINNYVYYTRELIFYLPLIQKITFASFLAWICIINFYLHKKIR